jgi:hypothetical protein
MRNAALQRLSAAGSRADLFWLSSTLFDHSVDVVLKRCDVGGSIGAEAQASVRRHHARSICERYFFAERRTNEFVILNDSDAESLTIPIGFDRKKARTGSGLRFHDETTLPFAHGSRSWR